MSWEDILKRNLSSVAHTDISTLNQNDPIVATDPNLTSRPARHLTETRCCVKAKQMWIELCEKYFGQMIRASNRRTIKLYKNRDDREDLLRSYAANRFNGDVERARPSFDRMVEEALTSNPDDLEGRGHFPYGPAKNFNCEKFRRYLENSIGSERSRHRWLKQLDESQLQDFRDLLDEWDNCEGESDVEG